MRKYLPLALFILASPIALAAVWLLIETVLTFPNAGETDNETGVLRLWAGSFGLGILIGYISCGLLIANLSRDGELNQERDYRFIAWGLSAGMIACFLLILTCCHANRGLLSGENFMYAGMISGLPVCAGWWALDKIVKATRKSGTV